jgi:hypothetical protein
MTPDEIARKLIEPHAFEADDGELILYVFETAEFLVEGIATALRAAKARGYERAREQAAGIASAYDEYGDGTITPATDAAYSIAAAIRAMHPEDKP